MLNGETFKTSFVMTTRKGDVHGSNIGGKIATVGNLDNTVHIVKDLGILKKHASNLMGETKY